MAANPVLTIWDQQGEPSNNTGRILCWQSYCERGLISSVPRYLELHAERLRATYLGFIHDLGERQIAGKRVIDYLNLENGFSLWWMTQLAEKSPFKSPRIYDCLRLLALEELLIEIHPSSVTLVGADETLAQAISKLCENLHMAFHTKLTIKPKKGSWLRRAYDALPFSLRGLISVRHAISRWPLRRTRNSAWFGGDNAMFMCSYFIHLDPNLCAQGKFYSRQWESLPKVISDLGLRTNWVQLFMLSAVVPDIATGLTWLRRFNDDSANQGRQAFLDEFLTLRLVLKALKNWLWLNRVSWTLRNIQSAFHVSKSAVWLWPLLRDDWYRSLIGPTAVANCLWLELFDASLGKMPRQQMGLYLCENQAWEKALLRAWRHHGHGKIIGVQHSTAPFWHLYYFDDPRSLIGNCDHVMPQPDFLAVNGAAARRAFENAGYPAERLVDVEALRYLSLLSLPAKSGRAAMINSRSPIVRVLILGDMIPEAMNEFLLLVAEAVKNLSPLFEFTFKPHPGYAVNLSRYPGLMAKETTESLSNILDRYDSVIAANSTSASVDAFVAGLPVIINLSGNELNLSPLRGHPGVCFVSTPEELVNALRVQQGGLAIARADREDFFFLDVGLPRWRSLLPTCRTQVPPAQIAVLAAGSK